MFTDGIIVNEGSCGGSLIMTLSRSC